MRESTETMKDCGHGVCAGESINTVFRLVLVEEKYNLDSHQAQKVKAGLSKIP